MYIGQLQWSTTMEETSETVAPEFEQQSSDGRLLSESMDGPSQSQNQDTSNAMEEIIDDDNSDNNAEDSTSNTEGVQE